MKAFAAIAALAFVICAANAVHAEVYMYEDSNGKILLTDKPRNGKQIAYISPSDSKVRKDSKRRGTSTGKPSSLSKGTMTYYTRYNSIIKNAASKYMLDHRLVSAVIQVESQFNPRAVSRTGAVGLMQLMPSTAKQLGVKDSYDPSQNIEGGTKYLRYLVERFKGNVTFALAAYNSGPLNVEKYGKVPPFKETQRYITKIYSIYKGKRAINLSSSGGKSIRRITLDDGSVVYSDYLQNGSPSF
ncbi:lytic transglycosylase domain-containing protein [Nitrospirota bacterium]